MDSNTAAVKRKVKMFTKGMKVFNKKVYPKHENLVSAVEKESNIKKLSKDGRKAKISATAVKIYEAYLEQEQERIVQESFT